MNMNDFYKLRHRKKVLQNFKNSFLKNVIIEFGSKVFMLSISNYASKENQVLTSNIIFTKIEILNFREKIMKIYIFVLL